MQHEHRGIWVVALPVTTVPDYRLWVAYGGDPVQTDDSYRFLPSVGEMDLHLIGEGRHEQLWQVLGAHVQRYETPYGTVDGTSFAVWAPNARGVRVVGDFNFWDGSHSPMRSLGASGVWDLFVPGVGTGTKYKFQILGADGVWRDKADPMAFATEHPPATSSVVFESEYTWSDGDWMSNGPRRTRTTARCPPMRSTSGSWRKGLLYTQLADELTDYLIENNFTHVEFLPVAEHPYEPSWGYQVTSYYAPSSRFGSPDEFRYLVDRLHQAGIGVIVDWVPAHFPKDEWALARFDGTALYEHADPRRGEQMDWGTLVFDFGRSEVRNFLVANAVFWLEEFHIDGLRVDAVASMLYLDYSREEGQWEPNIYGGRENLEAVSFLQEMNATVYKRVPGIVTIAEESTSWSGRHQADTSGRPRVRPEVEHGLDARHPRLRLPRADPPAVPPPRDDLRDDVRLLRAVRAADQPRRGRPRQGLADRQDARRPLAATGEPARLPRLHVGPSRQAAAVHGQRVRAVLGMVRGASRWTGGCWTTPSTGGSRPACAT